MPLPHFGSSLLLIGSLGCAAAPSQPSAPPPAPAPSTAYGAASSTDLEFCLVHSHLEQCFDQLYARNESPCNPAEAPRPLAPVAVKFPQNARERGITGWVDLEARISPAGVPMNPLVVGAEPAGVFERAAISAFQKWRYCPKAHFGKLVRTRIVFPPED